METVLQCNKSWTRRLKSEVGVGGSPAPINTHMILRAQFLNNHYIEIQLFDNSAVTRWFNYFKNFNNYQCSSGGILNVNSAGSPATATQSWNDIIDATNDIGIIGYRLPRPVGPVFDSNQETLNFWHRFFTYNVLWFPNKDILPNPYDAKFVMPGTVQHQDWFGIVDKINVAVHKLEIYTVPLANKKLIAEQYPLVELTFVPDRQHADLSTWFPFTTDEQQYNFNSFLDSTDPLALLNSSILGKSVLQAFYEHDDPTADDCTGRLGSFGGFVIDLTDNRRRLYQCAEFQSWLKQYNLDTTQVPYEFPIGTIVSASQALIDFRQTKFIKLEWVD